MWEIKLGKMAIELAPEEQNTPLEIMLRYGFKDYVFICFDCKKKWTYIIARVN